MQQDIQDLDLDLAIAIIEMHDFIIARYVAFTDIL